MRFFVTLCFLLFHLFGVTQAIYQRANQDFNGLSTFRDNQFQKDQLLSDSADGIIKLAPILSLYGNTQGQFHFGIGGNIQANISKLTLNASLGYRAFDLSNFYSGYQYTDSSHVAILGQGIMENGNVQKGVFARAFAKYQANKYFDLSIGYNSLFFGDGYRSLLMDDLAAPAPFVRLNASFWKVNYSVHYSALKAIDPYAPNKNQPYSFSTSHAFEIQPWKWLKINLFESIVWLGKDTLNARGFDLAYANPVIFFRPVEFSQGSNDNALLGGGITLYPSKNLALYGQVVIDEFLLDRVKEKKGWWANKQGWQFGAKWRNAFGIENLFVQGEYNAVRPFTFSHATYRTAYSNNGVSRAHYLGSNFNEILGVVRYEKNRWIYRASFTAFSKGQNYLSEANEGGNLLRPQSTYLNEFGNSLGQGRKMNNFSAAATAYYQVSKNKFSNLYASVGAGIMSRTGAQLGPYMHIGLRTQFPNFSPQP